MTDHGVIERFAVANIDFNGVFCREIVDVEVNDWIGSARFGVGFNTESRLKVGLIQGEVIVGYAAFIEAIESNLLTVGLPPDGGALIQFFTISPGRRAVFYPILGIAIFRDGDFASAINCAEPKISLAIKGLELAVR